MNMGKKGEGMRILDRKFTVKHKEILNNYTLNVPLSLMSE